MIRSLLRTAAAASLVALSATTASAQKQLAMCSFDNLVCFGAALSLTGTTLTVDLQNQGSVSPLNEYSQITGFGLFESPVDAGVEFYGTPTLEYINGGALPAAFTVALGAVPGLNTPNSGVEYTFGDDGLTPCGFNMTSGGNVDLPTCEAPTNSFLRLTFTNVSNVQLDNLQLAVRFQAVTETNGLPGSYKCYTGINPTGQDCVLVPGGGVGTGTLVPEPSTYALMGTGLIGLMGVAARRRRQS